MAKLVSKTYGEALFELAVEEGKEEELLLQIEELKKILADNPEFSQLMEHPNILKEDKMGVLKEVFKGRVDDDLYGFLEVVVEKGRYSELNDILDYFTDEVKAIKGIGVAWVKTPLELSDSQKKAVEAKLLETTSYKTMEMHFDIDESLIGGMVIRIKDRVVDSSVQAKLYKLQCELLSLQV